MKLGTLNNVWDLTLSSKYGSDGAVWGISAHAQNITVCDFPFLLFFVSLIFTLPTGRHIGPIFTIYTSNDAFSGKEVGARKMREWKRQEWTTWHEVTWKCGRLMRQLFLLFHKRIGLYCEKKCTSSVYVPSGG